jgi:hypothetical protein
VAGQSGGAACLAGWVAPLVLSPQGPSGAVRCPYPGLMWFGPEFAGWFFRRDELIAELINRLDRHVPVGGPVSSSRISSNVHRSPTMSNVRAVAQYRLYVRRITLINTRPLAYYSELTPA